MRVAQPNDFAAVSKHSINTRGVNGFPLMDGIDAQLFGKFIDGAFECEEVGDLGRRAHRTGRIAVDTHATFFGFDVTPGVKLEVTSVPSMTKLSKRGVVTSASCKEP